jgi:hypothetical protein
MSDKRGIGDLWPSALASAAKAGSFAAGVVLACIGVSLWHGLLVLGGAATMAAAGTWIVAAWRD